MAKLTLESKKVIQSVVKMINDSAKGTPMFPAFRFYLLGSQADGTKCYRFEILKARRRCVLIEVEIESGWTEIRDHERIVDSNGELIYGEGR